MKTVHILSCQLMKVTPPIISSPEMEAPFPSSSGEAPLGTKLASLKEYDPDGSTTGITALPVDNLRMLNNYNNKFYTLFREHVAKEIICDKNPVPRTKDGYTVRTKVLANYSTLEEAIIAWLAFHESPGDKPHQWRNGAWKYKFIPKSCRDLETRRDSEYYYFIKETPFGPAPKKEIIYSFYNRRLWKYEWQDPDKLPHQLDFHFYGTCRIDKSKRHKRRNCRLTDDCLCEPFLDNRDIEDRVAMEEHFTLPEFPELSTFDWDILEPLKEKVKKKYEYCHSCRHDVEVTCGDSD